jgi:GNAT superfamily N-acetyltransferase
MTWDVAGMAYRFTLSDKEDRQKAIPLLEALSADNERAYGRALPWRRVNVFIEDRDGQLVGGLLGELFWGWLDIRILWIDPSHRRKGLGRKLVSMAEREARKHGVDRAMLSTAEFQAPEFYKRLGYEIFAVLDDTPPGSRVYHMKKQLIA